jgi:hypothetical protein
MLYIGVLAGCFVVVIACLAAVMIPPHARKH